MGIEAVCLGWLLIMDVYPSSRPLVTTTICVQSEHQCRQVATQRESVLSKRRIRM